MFLRKTTLALPLLLAALPIAASGQGQTPTHTSTTPLSLPPFDSTVIFATLIAPPVGETILKTELHIGWITDGTQSAEFFGMHLSTNSLPGGPSPDWEIIGTDLGWDDTPGAHFAIAETDLFNGTLLGGPFGGATFDLVMEKAGGGGLFGIVANGSKLVFHLGTSVSTPTAVVSLFEGGVQSWELNAGPTVGPGAAYIVAGSITGSTPGFDLGSVHVPLGFDAYTNFTFTKANQGPLVNTLGFLDASGQSTASLQIPGGTAPELAGLTLHHAMLTFDVGQGLLTSASNAVPLTLAP